MGEDTGDAAGLSGPPGVLLTREVRWFHAGRLPPDVIDWFTAPAGTQPEQRLDSYDLGAAGRGIGIKRRSRDYVDAKFPLRRNGPVELAPAIVGRVEDWVKLTFPAGTSRAWVNGIEVEKDIVARRFHLPAHPDSGCEVELAAIKAGPRRSWTFALETFGPAWLLEESLQAGIDGLLAAAPYPEAFRLDGRESYGYPAWISQLVEIG